ncbi:helix-turn-helix transcriptional regulator (plasmid) [Nocardioides sp. R1-1]|uniref:helix-turn-helix transcriptional regulator n=1 Tax=Nocardioides sp. R1-1 TaxID=3383502 RepID=UPI0038D13AF6
MDADVTAAAAHLGEASLELLASIVSEGSTIGSDDTLRARVGAYVRAHLTDLDLSHNSVAAAHTMSPRSLHRLFHDEPQSVMEMARSLRLEAIRTALADPLQRGRSTMAIANRLGYADAAHFNRAFRARFGTTPGAYRRSALGQ